MTTAANRRRFDPLDRMRHSMMYGTRHKAERRAWEPMVLRGMERCRRGSECKHAEMIGGRLIGGLIHPGEPWDLGHIDGNPLGYSGPEHASCNRATAGRRAWQKTVVRVSQVTGKSREW